jgi:hypothetical protein
MAGLSAGVGVDEACLTAFNLVKTKKKDFQLFEINAAGTFVVPVPGGSFPEEKDDVAAFEADTKREANFAARVYPKFKDALIARGKNPCYAVLDLRYLAEGDRPTDKLIFVFWCPDNVGVRQKMVGASTYTSFSAKLGVAAKIQAQDASDLELASLISKAGK